MVFRHSSFPSNIKRGISHSSPQLISCIDSFFFYLVKNATKVQRRCYLSLQYNLNASQIRFPHRLAAYMVPSIKTTYVVAIFLPFTFLGMDGFLPSASICLCF